MDRAAVGGRVGGRGVTRPYRRSTEIACAGCGLRFSGAPSQERKYCSHFCANRSSRNIHRVHTDDVLRTCRRLWNAGMSISAIGVRLNVTRNVVVGIAHRNGFPGRPSPIKRVAA